MLIKLYIVFVLLFFTSATVITKTLVLVNDEQAEEFKANNVGIYVFSHLLFYISFIGMLAIGAVGVFT